MHFDTNRIQAHGITLRLKDNASTNKLAAPVLYALTAVSKIQPRDLHALEEYEYFFLQAPTMIIII